MPSSSGSYTSVNGLVRIDWSEGKSVIKMYINKKSK